jgi:WD40 repeat protein/tRNA A-37 threonylcarbamoyl transferase component Bud32
MAEDIHATDSFQQPDPPSGETASWLPPSPHPVEAVTLPPASAPGAVPADIPVQVPGYEILNVLGRGGMGVVYRARQLKLNRTVALKMILAGGHASADDQFRFLREAEAVAQLQHPNIVQVFESGQHQGLPYFTLEFVPGGSLADRVREHPLPPAEAAQVVERLAPGMAYAHERGIVHRDLKPENVLLGEDGTPKLADFGLVKRLPTEPGLSVPGGLTQSGAIMGTPSYMAPEQAGGQSREVGPATDIYALGAVLYRLLTGRPPFQAATPLDTILQVLHNEPVPPGQLQPKVPRDLETICLKCLQKEPKKRYGSAAALAEDLRRFREGEPILARPVGMLERALKWGRRRPAQAALVAVVLGAALSLLGGGVWFTLKLDQERRRAEHLAQEEGKARADAQEKERQADLARRDALDKAEKLRREQQEKEKQLERAELALYVNRVAFADRETEARNFPRSNAILDQCRRDYRNWEWHHLRYRNHYPIPPQTWDGHAGAVRGVAFSPDGSRLASASQDRTVQVRDVRSGAVTLSLKGHTGPVTGVAFSPNGTRLASASQDQTVKVWDARTGIEIGSLQGHTGAVLGVTFSPDGNRLASAGGDATVKVWDVRAGRDERTLRGHTGPVISVAFSPDGSRLASASLDKTVRGWDARSGAEVLTIKEQVSCVAFSPDGSRLAGSLSRFVANMVKVWDARSGAEIRSLSSSLSSPGVMACQGYGVSFSPDGKLLACASRVGDFGTKVNVWDMRTGAEIVTLQGFKSYDDVATALAFSPDGSRLAGACGNPDNPGTPGQVKVWDTRFGVEVRSVRDDVWSLAFSPDGSRLAGGCGEGMVKVWDVRSGALLLSLEGHSRDLFVSHVAFSPDGKRLASATEGKETVKVWDAQTGAPVLSHEGFKDFPNGPAARALSHDGSRLASRTTQTVEVSDARSGSGVLSLKMDIDPLSQVTSVAFSPDGSRLAAASVTGNNSTLRVWYAPSGALVNGQQEDDWVTIAWHVQQADTAREARDDRAHRFHFHHALTALAEQGRARLAEGDRAGYQQVCPVLLALAEQSNDPRQAAAAAWTCALAADAVPDYTRLVKLARRAGGDTDAGRLGLGAVLLRAGQAEEAVKQLKEALTDRGAASTALDELLLALAYHQLGQAGQARRWLERGSTWFDQHRLDRCRAVTGLLGAVAAGPLPALVVLAPDRADSRAWQASLELRLLCTEAETVLGVKK